MIATYADVKAVRKAQIAAGESVSLKVSQVKAAVVTQEAAVKAAAVKLGEASVAFAQAIGGFKAGQTGPFPFDPQAAAADVAPIAAEHAAALSALGDEIRRLSKLHTYLGTVCVTG